MDRWKVMIRLNDICEYGRDKINVSGLDVTNYISTENMNPNRGGITNATTLPSTLTVAKVQIGDVLVSNIRPYFKKIWHANKVGGCSNDVLILRAKPGIDKKFLYYVLADDRFFEYATATAKGTKMPRGDKTAIMQYEVPNLSLFIQKKIAGVLSSIDDKILCNERINRNLQAQAHQIFKREFLELDEVPNGWKEGSLVDIADYLNGLAMQKFRPKDDEIGLPVLKIKELRQGACDASSEQCSPTIKKEYIIHDGDVIFSWSGSLLVDCWCGGDCGLNQHLFKVTSSQYDKWFYYAWTMHHLERFIAVAADKATTMGHIKREELSKAEVLIPNEADYERIGALLEPMYNMIINNRIENRKLASIRNELLPKLMSGEIDVTELDV